MLRLGAHPIPRDARLIMHDGNPPAHHAIEQGGFADIGTTDDGDETRHDAENEGVVNKKKG